MARLTDYSRFDPYNAPKKRKAWPVLLSIIIVITIILSVGKNLSKHEKDFGKLISPLAKSVMGVGVSIIRPDKQSQNLEQVVRKNFHNTKGDYAVAIKNLKTGERYYYNEHKIFESASLYKLFVMGTVFQKIQNGDFDQTDNLSQKIETLNEKFRISSESAELTEGEISLPVQSALTRMVTISDNYSALLLTEKVKLSQVALFLNQYSLNDSHVGTNGESPVTSAFDLVSFFEKLYNQELASKDLTQEMLSLLKAQTINTKLPKYLPKGTITAHKTGELDFLSHDAGIVYTEKGDYVIVVLTKTNSPADANEKIALISSNVFNYFTK